MAKKQFKSLKELQEYAEKEFPKFLFNDGKLEQFLKKTMRESVYKTVYAKYTPEVYERRKDDGGLSDMRAMQITQMIMNSGTLNILFENLTKGSHYSPMYGHPQDSLHGQLISETIEKGIRKNWYNPDETDKYGRKPSVPRPFVEETMNMIKANPQPLIDAVKDAFIKCGFKIK